MKITLKLENTRDADKKTTGGIRARAWSNWSKKDGTATVHVVRPFDRHFFALGRKAHEVEHILSDLGNEMHEGHTWHFCGRSWHAIRLFPRIHVDALAVRVARELVTDGQWVMIPLREELDD